jgi:hypothetical protein
MYARFPFFAHSHTRHESRLFWTLWIITLGLAILAMLQSPVLGVSNPKPSAPDPFRIKVVAYSVITIAGSKVLQPVVLTVPDDQNRLVFAINAMAGFQDSPLPAGTRVRSLSLDDNGIAILDLNVMFLNNPAGDGDAADLAVKAIVQVLVQDIAIKAVKITVDSSPIKAVEGSHFDLSSPIPVTTEKPKRFLHRRIRNNVPYTIALGKQAKCQS